MGRSRAIHRSPKPVDARPGLAQIIYEIRLRIDLDISMDRRDFLGSSVGIIAAASLAPVGFLAFGEPVDAVREAYRYGWYDSWRQALGLRPPGTVIEFGPDLVWCQTIGEHA